LPLGQSLDMRSFILVPVLLAGLAAVSGAAPQSSRRKSLGFGPILPHAVFKSSAGGVPTPFVGFLSGFADPFDVARTFVEDLLGDQLSPDSTFFFREDSYTDKNTGVTHVYVRQLVNGIVVADGNINVNVLGGRVISYGNSVRVSVPSGFRFHSLISSVVLHGSPSCCLLVTWR
jgi:extracellular elastinolytic metalloproteinase